MELKEALEDIKENLQRKVRNHQQDLYQVEGDGGQGIISDISLARMTTPILRTNTMNSRRRTTYDKTSYGTIPTSLSPTDSLPTLIQSTSNMSNSSSSPPQPTTPPRPSRSRTRYGDIGRVPLHRRGTSKTYERLEDLLKEAGYKETRIFTPEGERTEAAAQHNASAKSIGMQEERRSSMRDGVGAVVGFLAGLMPGTTVSRPTSAMGLHDAPEDDFLRPPSPRAYSPPGSPLAHRQSQKQKAKTSPTSDSTTPTNMYSPSLESLGDALTPRTGGHNLPSRSTTPGIPPTQSDYQQHLSHRVSGQNLSAAQRHLQKQASRASLHHPVPFSPLTSSSSMAHPRPSRAGAYLRHMSSTPNMPLRPSSTPAHRSRNTIVLNDSDNEEVGGGYGRRGNGEGEEDPQPPLPLTWLETVARAVLFGGAGAYAGGPSNAPAPKKKPELNQDTRGRPQTLRATRSSISQRRRSKPPRARVGLSDQTNHGREGFLAPPPLLLMQLGRGRAGRSEGEISQTRVTCRSAPGSRATSAVRGEDRREKAFINAVKERGRDRRRKDSDRLPSLAKTQTEGDSWVQEREKGKKSTGGRAGNRYLSGWGMGEESDDESDEDGEHHTASSEDEDGELDLARILVPPKRQNSIKSLRKHLTAEAGGSNSRASLMRVPSNARVSQGMSVIPASANRSNSLVQRRRVEEDWDGEENGGEDWGRGWAKRGTVRRPSEDDDEFAGFLGEERDRDRKGFTGSGRSGTKNRLGVPGNWNLIGNGS
ncbi:hypothetical protein BDQ12DRAFT_709610 [Crucibulum laeve]|uniref:Uncharacterized protein n=1 Tax=Crucibulum laeve TaxID=68775 RepID=A0A5C3MH23_9AGAR|nr:hypothetical protein BDQ12DRAFT_709610 [Crucibulum laeve]